MRWITASASHSHAQPAKLPPSQLLAQPNFPYFLSKSLSVDPTGRLSCNQRTPHQKHVALHPHLSPLLPVDKVADGGPGLGIVTIADSPPVPHVQVDQVADENSRLHAQLEGALQRLMAATQQCAEPGAGASSAMAEQMSLLREENGLLLEQQRQADGELQQLRETVQV